MDRRVATLWGVQVAEGVSGPAEISVRRLLHAEI